MPESYLDHAATTRLRPVALAALTEALTERWGNPSGAHGPARHARRALDDARDLVAAAVGAEPGEVVFTSGGTEADNLAVRGVHAAVGGTVAAGATEHHAVLEPVAALDGATVAVDPLGRLDLDALDATLREAAAAGRPVRLLSVMAANNETGARNDLHAVADRLAAAASSAEPGPSTGGGAAAAGRVVLHTDAVAAAAWLDLRHAAAPADLVTLSGHKVGGPKGIGALVVRRGTPLRPLLLGGGQEQERRSGTPDVAGAVAFAAALDEAVREREATVARVEALRGRLVAGLAAIDGVEVLSPADPSARTAGTVLAGVRGVDREALVFLLDRAGIAASWGSSCASGASEPSHVLAAMGVEPELARGALRLSLGWCSTEADVAHLLDVLPGAVADLRGGAAP